MTSELKPCPFCASSAEITEYHKDNFEVQCSSEGCGVRPNTILSDKETVVADWNTRAVPAVPELKRYRVYDNIHGVGEEECEYGDYVHHEDAEAVIAAKDAEIEALTQDSDGRASIAYSAGYYQAECNLPEHEREVDTLAEYRAMKAKLTQIEKQEAVCWLEWQNQEEGYAICSKTCFGAYEGMKLYAAPVASDADLRAENERLREALKPFAAFANALSDNAPDDVALGLMAGGQISFGPSGATIGGLREARAALNPSEPKS